MHLGARCDRVPALVVVCAVLTGSRSGQLVFLAVVAAYFTKLKWPDLQQPTAPKDVAAKALSAISSIGCPSCHLDQLQGDGTTARLAGQQREYLQKTMIEFRDRTRGNNPGMSDLMKAISPDDITAIAEYLAGLQFLVGSGWTR